MRRLWAILVEYHALLLIVAVFLASLIKVIMVSIENNPPETIVIRVGHWQLEAGVREGFNELAEEYSKLHPNVKVIQDAIPEAAYSQWLSTQFIGGTAPDIVEMGMLPFQIMISFYNRYVIPLTPIVNRPNPYNKGTEFEDTPWRNTFVDGLSSGYVNEIQEYMSIPMAGFTTRAFYNRDLLRKITGKDTPPSNYRDFLEVCRIIKEYREPDGTKYTPLVGSKYHFNIWQSAMADVLTYRLLEKADLNRDGGVSNDELFVAVKSGRLSFAGGPIESSFRMVRELAENCQVGFVGLGRDDGVFLFAQEKAVFISTGTWDISSLMMLSKDKFEVAVMDFPFPGTDDPVHGEFAIGPRYNNPGQGANFVVTRHSKHPEVALDFLQFIASKSMNEKFNKTAGWIPAISNTQKIELLNEFEPTFYGIYNNFTPNLGGETYIRWMQLTSLYMVNQISYEDMIQEFEPFYKRRGVTDFLELRKDWQRGLWVVERFLCGLRAQAMTADSDSASGAWIRYRLQTTSRQIYAEYNNLRQIKLVTGAMDLPEYGPYEYTTQAMERIRRHALQEKNE